MASGNSVVRIAVYGKRDAAVPFAASLLLLLACINFGLAFFRELSWIAFLAWAVVTSVLAFDFWESRNIIVDREKKTVHLGRKRLQIADIKSIERTEVRGFMDVISLRRVKVKVAMRDGSMHCFPLAFTPSIADRVDRIVAELRKHAKA